MLELAGKVLMNQENFHGSNRASSGEMLCRQIAQRRFRQRGLAGDHPQVEKGRPAALHAGERSKAGSTQTCLQHAQGKTTYVRHVAAADMEKCFHGVSRCFPVKGQAPREKGRMQAVYRTGIARTFFMDAKDLARKSWSVPYFSFFLETVVCPLFSAVFTGQRITENRGLSPIFLYFLVSPIFS